MTLESQLHQRANSQCELCGATDNLGAYLVPPENQPVPDQAVLVCAVCRQQIAGDQEWQPAHWRGLSETMWSTTPAVQVMAWRILNKLQHETWAQDLLDMLYLEDAVLAWAQAGLVTDNEDAIVHRDSNGAVLTAGDTVTLTKDLSVKGANFTAKRGTAVRGISLVADNQEQIEGKINGQRIVILTRFVKKA